jgi:hypothetical protein
MKMSEEETIFVSVKYETFHPTPPFLKITSFFVHLILTLTMSQTEDSKCAGNF